MLASLSSISQKLQYSFQVERSSSSTMEFLLILSLCCCLKMFFWLLLYITVLFPSYRRFSDFVSDALRFVFFFFCFLKMAKIGKCVFRVKKKNPFLPSLDFSLQSFLFLMRNRTKNSFFYIVYMGQAIIILDFKLIQILL